MAPLWAVVGGAAEGGVLVRKSRRVVAPAEGKRLELGSQLEQVELSGEQLHYRIVSGAGPVEGWISIYSGCRCGSTRCAPFTVLAECVEGAPPEEPEVNHALPSTTAVVNIRAALVGEAPAAGPQPSPSPSPSPANDEEEPAAAGDRVGGGGRERFLERCQAEWQKDVVAWRAVSMEDLAQNHAKECAGMRYGMPFPHNPELLESTRYGAKWLTEAFHAAGTLPKDNRVTKLFNMRPVSGGGACLKARFEVQYEKPAAGLHTKLFMKYPFDFENPKQRTDRMNSSVNLQTADLAELDSYRLLEAYLPFPMPKYYFGDISNESTNFVLITELIPFGDKKKPMADFKPFEVEPAYDKFLDDEQLSDTLEYYAALTRANATMAGWYKSGRFGDAAKLQKFFADQSKFAPASGLPDAEFAMKLKMGVEFLKNAEGFFPPGLISEANLQTWKRVLTIANAYKPEIYYAAGMNEDACAMAHGNMNVDNTWWWRDQDKKLHVGVLDWGGLGKVSLPVKLWWSYYACEVHFLERHLDGLLDLFVDTYAQEGGPRLDAAVLRRDFFFAALDQCVGLLGAVPAIYRAIPKKSWAAGDVKDRDDRRLRSDFLTRMYVLGLVLITRMIFLFDFDKMCADFLKTPGLPRRKLPEV